MPFTTTTPKISTAVLTTNIPHPIVDPLPNAVQLMDPSNLSEPAPLYRILNLSPSLISTQHDPSPLIKRAYRRALLQNHPDKATSFSQVRRSEGAYSIDQITKAFNVLSSPAQRAAYDTSLKLQSDSEGQGLGTKFQTGVESVDLDDLDFDEQKECWYRSCRCGNDRGYLFQEDDLAEVSEEGELMVGCLDCSLWLRVHFAVVEDEEEPQVAKTEPTCPESNAK